MLEPRSGRLAPEHHSLVEQAARLVSGAYALVVVTGAGMGIDSGLPDFRGRNGFWNAYPALGRHRIDFAQIASPDAFQDHPRLAWGFYGHRLALYRATQPHTGFDILRRWMKNSLLGGAVFTSNVDEHFQRAGFHDCPVVECHGSIHHLQCLEGCCKAIWPATPFIPDVDEQTCLLRNDLPHCPHCGGIARPNICMFNDYQWAEQRTREQYRQLEHWLATVERLLVIEIGAGRAIPTARNFTRHTALKWDAPVIRINPDDAAIHGNPSHVSLPMGALDALTAIDGCL